MFSIFFFCLLTLTGQMPSMTNCMPMPIPIANPIEIPSSSNSTYQLPCFPPIDSQKELPHVNEQEFTDCMMAKINNISRLDNQSRAVLDKMDNFVMKDVINKNQAAQREEFIQNELFDLQDMNKDGYLTNEEISQFELHYFVPYYLEKWMKDPKIDQFAMAFSYAWIFGDDLGKAKANFDMDAAKFVQAKDTNGDGKLNRGEMKMTRFG